MRKLLISILFIILFVNSNAQTMTLHMSDGSVFTNNIEEIDSVKFSTEIASIKILIDIDGNSYNTVLIGSQTWMAENLVTTKYNDGTNIIFNASNINATRNPGYYWYDADPDVYKEMIGAIYNGYAVQTGKLCPIGWHVPTDYEWNTLEMYLGTNVGSKLAGKSEYWRKGVLQDNSEFGKSGFNALPSGAGFFTTTIPTYAGLNDTGNWWTSTDADSDYFYWRRLNYNGSNIARGSSDKRMGYCVRCLKD